MKTERNIIAIGNFDGFHAGHQKLLRELKDREEDGNIVVLSFDPHPKLYFDKTYSLISTRVQREELIRDFGVKDVIFWNFANIVNLDPEEFIRSILITRLRVKEVIVGHDFNFGKNRSGNIDDLKNYAKKYGFRLSVISPVMIDKYRVSSSYIREQLGKGRVDDKITLKMLTRKYYIDAEVIKGKGIGRGLGFPTINLKTNNRIIPNGVFETVLKVQKEIHRSITNIGLNPTFNRKEFGIETYILNFEGNLYNQPVRLYFIRKLRDEKFFSSKEKLVAQIKQDILEIKE